MKSNSGGSVPKRAGKKRQSYEPQSAAEMNRKLGEALKRLGDPVADYRQKRERIIRRKIK